MPALLFQGHQPVLPADHVLDPDAEIAVDHDYFAAGDHAVVHHQLDRLRDGAIKLDDRAGGELKYIPEEQFGAAERNADGQFDVQQEIEGFGIIHIWPQMNTDKRRLNAARAGPALFHIRAQAQDRLRFQLGYAGFVQADNLRDFAQRQLLIVVEAQHGLFDLGHG